MYYGIDIGRSHTKVISDNTQIIFPSYVSPQKDLDLTSINNHNISNISISINDNSYFIGELAKKHHGSKEFTKEKINHQNTIPLIITALTLSTPESYNLIYPKCVIGLPISDYRTQASKFEKSVLGKYQIKLFKKIININVEKLLTFPEGAGIAWGLLLEDNGKQNNSILLTKTIAIIDIGWKTVNFLVLRNSEYDDSISGTLPLGIHQAYINFYKRISREYDYLPHQVEQMLSIQGEPELIQLAQQIQDQLSIFWTVMTQFDYIFVGGGGGILLYKYFTIPVKLIKDAQFANAKGFYRIAKSQL